MGKEYDKITDSVKQWILEQKVFYVGTAGAKGLLNISPKGLQDGFTFLPTDENCKHICKISFYDVGGSGVETIAHVRENGRMTIMFCGYEGKPRIMRFYGHAKCITATENPQQWQQITPYFSSSARSKYFQSKNMQKSNKNSHKIETKLRCIFIIDVDRVRSSCGFGVPLFKFIQHRDIFLEKYYKDDEMSLKDYKRKTENYFKKRSLDNKPTLRKYDTWMDNINEVTPNHWLSTHTISFVVGIGVGLAICAYKK